MNATPAPPKRTSIEVDDATLSVACWGDGPIEIVLLHDGLGSIDQWRDIPANVAARTGRAVLAYDRPGHGRSQPVPDGPWPADWLHTEADRLERLFEALTADGDIQLRNPLLVGHSDGGSIALLYAAGQRSTSVRGAITLAAHSWVEQSCYDAIVGMRASSAPIVAGLARNHEWPDAIFEAWSGVWVSDDFRPWDIRPMLHTITCPTLVAQGRGDEYASDAHAEETAAAVGENGECLLLDDVGHLLHHQDPDLIVKVVTEFDSGLGPIEGVS